MTLNVTVLGAGHFGTAITNYLSKKTSHQVTVASRSTEIPPERAVENADIVILAVPSTAYHSFVPRFVSNLREGTVILDASNSPLSLLSKSSVSAAHTLRKILPAEIFVVKALNTLSAIQLTELTEDEAFTKSILLPFAGDHGSVKTMETLINDMGFTPIYKGDLSAAEYIESIPHTLFPSYRSSFFVSLVVWAWWILYSTLSTYVIHGGRGEPSRPWDKFPLSMFMASTGETAQTLFAITFLAGPIATMFKALRRPLGKFLIEWLDHRKQLGLSAFIFVSAHGIAGAISASHLDDGWKGQLYFVFGILSGSTAASLSWAEFRAVFSLLGTAAFALGILHQGFWGAIILQHVPNPSFWVGGGKIMPIYWLGIILPIFVILLRAASWTPCVSLAGRRGAVYDQKYMQGEVAV